MVFFMCFRNLDKTVSGYLVDWYGHSWPLLDFDSSRILLGLHSYLQVVVHTSFRLEIPTKKRPTLRFLRLVSSD